MELTDPGPCAVLRYPPPMRRQRRALGPALRSSLPIGPLAIGLLLISAVPGCRITPDEIQRIETENDLLREQIHAMRMECEQYRQLQLEIEEPGETPRPRDDNPDRQPPAPQ